MVCFLFSPYPNPTSEFIQAPTTQCANLPIRPRNSSDLATTISLCEMHTHGPICECVPHVDVLPGLLIVTSCHLSGCHQLVSPPVRGLPTPRLPFGESQPPVPLLLPGSLPASIAESSQLLNKTEENERESQRWGGSEDNPMPVQTPSLLPAARLERAL